MLKHYKFLIIVWILLCGFSNQIIGQQTLKRKGTFLPLTIFKPNNDTISIQTILKSDHLFKPSKAFIEKANSSDTYWLKIDFKEELKTLGTADLWYLRFTRFNYTTVYYSDSSIIKHKEYGESNPNPETPSSSILFMPGMPFSSSNLINKRYLYLKVKSALVIRSLSNFQIAYLSPNSNSHYTDFYSSRELKILIPFYIFEGVCIIMFLLNISIFIYSKKPQYLFYALYILSLLIYLCIPNHNSITSFLNLPLLTIQWGIRLFQVFINLFYIIFVSYYLNTHKEYPKLHKAIKIIGYALLLIIVLDCIFFVTKLYIAHFYIMQAQRFIMVVFGVFGMTYLIFKAKDRLAYFIVAGSFLYMTGALMSLFFNPLLYMVIGSSLEIMVFSLGIAYKISLEHKEKLVLEQTAFEYKISALRAQMNPHFVFNSLSSIQHLITTNKKESAITYLNKFSHLMRKILENSIELNVLLSDEIKMLNKYLELESLRFDGVFTNTIKVHQNLSPETIEVPSLIVQPFVENAIIHGLINKKGGPKNLTISFKKDNDAIVCEVEDNGIGRQATHNTQIKKTNKSRGISITEKRLQILNRLKDGNIVIIDKIDGQGKPTGTKVIIRILLN